VSAWVDLQEVGKGNGKMRQLSGVEPYETRPRYAASLVRATPAYTRTLIPGASRPYHRHALLHQMVRVERAGVSDRYGTFFVDTNLSFAV